MGRIIMTVWQFEDKIPKIGKNTYIAESADIIGNVVIGDDCYIGPGARIRGDYGKIVIGSGCSIQENVVIHARPDEQTTIGDRVTIGHGSVIHNCTLENFSVVGMGAVVSDYAKLEEWAVLGENGLVRQNQEISAEKVAVGVPAKVIGPLKTETKEELQRFKDKYVEMAHRHLKGIKKLP